MFNTIFPHIGQLTPTLVWHENGTSSSAYSYTTYLADLSPAGGANTLNSQSWTRAKESGTACIMKYNTTTNAWYTQRTNSTTQRAAYYNIAFPNTPKGIAHEADWVLPSVDAGSGAFSNTGSLILNSDESKYALWYMYDDNVFNDLYFIIDGVTKYTILNFTAATYKMKIQIDHNNMVSFYKDDVLVGPPLLWTGVINKLKIYGYTETGTNALVSGTTACGWKNEKIYEWL